MKPEQPTDINDFIIQQKQAGEVVAQNIARRVGIQTLIEEMEQDIVRQQ